MAVKSERKGNPVIYLALAVPGALLAIGIYQSVARHTQWIGATRTMEVPAQSIPSNPAKLIEAKDFKYVG